MAEPRSRAAQLLGARIKEVRVGRGMSQEDLAALAEMHVTNIGKIERGQANPSLITIVRIASVLDADPGALVAGLSGADVPPTTHGLTARDLIRERSRRAG